MEGVFQGLELRAEGTEGGGVFPAGVEERLDVGDEVDLQVEQPGAEDVDVLAFVDGEGEGVAGGDPHVGVLHELQVKSKCLFFHLFLILMSEQKRRRSASCSSPSG